jgi:uncharacterized membrane protein YgdD (TMEM256/DUF423 family)
MHRIWIGLGALAGLAAVALSAWAAHAAPRTLDAPRLAMLDSALTMQGWHALALLFAGLWADRRDGILPHLAAGGIALGMLLFCGAVCSAAIGGVSLGPVAPAGGVLLMAGWALLVLSAAWPPRRPR